MEWNMQNHSTLAESSWADSHQVSPVWRSFCGVTTPTTPITTIHVTLCRSLALFAPVSLREPTERTVPSYPSFRGSSSIKFNTTTVVRPRLNTFHRCHGSQPYPIPYAFPDASRPSHLLPPPSPCKKNTAALSRLDATPVADHQSTEASFPCRLHPEPPPPPPYTSVLSPLAS
ncbi:hypothetical protein EX30DRAFT_256791 [Ascodesmis nigricans]|uniref:Uncharacterized protein n=1 Tax=Ascodesmis nigricans TaxID=341454 RepID=A0A4S2MME4_9PEZI|nr:hypothetical protein EX30DRAFT_256791 [Ascodesmis nigricans]